MEASANTSADLSSLDLTVEAICEQGITIAQARGLSRNDLEAIYSVSYNLYQQHKFSQAEQVFRFLSVYGHTDKRFWLGLAASQQALEHFESAIESYSYVAFLDHTNPTPPMQAALCYLALQNTDKAEKALTAAIHWSENKPEHTPVLTKATALLNIVRNQGNQENTP